MRSSIAIFALAAYSVSAGLVERQASSATGSDSLTDCAASCAGNAPSTSCTGTLATSFQCLCNDSAWLSSIVTCISSTCGGIDQSTAQAAANSVCGAYQSGSGASSLAAATDSVSGSAASASASSGSAAGGGVIASVTSSLASQLSSATGAAGSLSSSVASRSSSARSSASSSASASASSNGASGAMKQGAVAVAAVGLAAALF